MDGPVVPDVESALEVNTIEINHAPNGDIRNSGIISSLSETTTARNHGAASMIRHDLILGATPRPLEYPASKVTALLPENESEALFLSGYDSDGLLPNIPDPDEDLEALEDYSSTPIGRESEGDGDVGANDGENNLIGTNGDGDEGEVRFTLITDDDIGKLRVDGLRKELKTRGLSVKGLKRELVERLQRAMVDKVENVVVSNVEVANV